MDWLRGMGDWMASVVGGFAPGTVALVGAGPGDSGLISVRGAVRLMQADVVLYDKLVGEELLALPSEGAELVFVGKRRGEHTWRQEAINAALVEHAQAGKRVVRLKGGDPFVFGRGAEECEHLSAAGVRYEVVPGVTAAFGAPTTAGIPLTHRGVSRSFTLVTGHAEPGDVEGLNFDALAGMETLVFYMGLKNLAANCAGLIAGGMRPATPAAVIHWGTTSRQRTVVGTLADIADRVEAAKVEPPAMVLVGEVVRLRERIEWFERRPLFGLTIVVTRMREQAAALSGALRAAGAEVLEAPTIALAEPVEPAGLDHAVACLREYDWVVVTSVNGVDALFGRLRALGGDARWLGGVEVAAVGSATSARLSEYGVRADLVPGEATGEALGVAMVERDVAGRRVLLLRGDLAGQELPGALRAGGARCDEVTAYRTVCPAALPEGFLTALDAGRVDWIALTSPSAWVNLLHLLGEERRDQVRQVRLASIGPVTSKAIIASGMAVSAEGVPHDVSGLVAAIIEQRRQEE